MDVILCVVSPGSSRQSTGLGGFSRSVDRGVKKPVQHLALSAGKGVCGTFASPRSKFDGKPVADIAGHVLAQPSLGKFIADPGAPMTLLFTFTGLPVVRLIWDFPQLEQVIVPTAAQ